MAAAVGNVEAIAALLAAGAKLEARAGEGGFTPMHAAMATGTAEPSKRCWRRERNWKREPSAARPPCMWAASVGNTDAIAALAAAGADLEAQTESGFTPLHCGGQRRDR